MDSMISINNFICYPILDYHILVGLREIQ